MDDRPARPPRPIELSLAVSWRVWLPRYIWPGRSGVFSAQIHAGWGTDMMKTALVAATIAALGVAGAKAADLAARPYVKAPPAAAAVYDWTGFYVGGNIG
jgi:hypothetical protein